MYDTIRSILHGTEFPVVESFVVEPRPARYGKIPQFLFSSPVGDLLDQRYPGGLWAHQASALEALGKGDNLVISTGTASGKSLVFQSLAFHKLLSDPSSKIAVLYPLRALVADQLRGWNNLARDLDLEEDVIGRIDGTVLVRDRIPILNRARVVIMTPDVVQSWLMSSLATPVVRDFIKTLSTLVVDEAHTWEGVFGSNSSFLIRRLIAARNHLLRNEGAESPLQFVTATATIADPGEHMRLLTGSKFSVVDHESDGAPRHERIVAHVACPPDLELQIAEELQGRMLSQGDEGSFITFVDSRKGVETLAIASQQDIADLSKHPQVSPYRAGYTPEERSSIERRLRSSALRGVVSTSALELGIDLPNLQVGLSVGIPPTRKAYRQRLGRVGRGSAGAFVVIAPVDAFHRYGTTFREYHDMSVEPSYLYLDNRFMQFAHSRCLAVERESLAAPSRLPARTHWPHGFGEIYQYALPSGNRPVEFDDIARLGGDTPHRGYPLRNIGDVNFQIRYSQNGDSIGEVTAAQALRECYPGATYYHNGRAYEVLGWTAGAIDSFVRVRNTSPHRITRPQIRTWVRAKISDGEVIADHYVRGTDGFLVECRMLVTERVEGYYDGQGRFHSYRELQQSNPRMQSRARNFRTTGVILFVDQPWFRESEVKRIVSDRIMEMFTHEYSILTHDIGSAATNISVGNVDAGAGRGSCIAIFDTTYGSLRFTEKLFLEFGHILGRLKVAAEAEMVQGSGQLLGIVDRIREEVESFTPGTALGAMSGEERTGYELLFTIGSRVLFQQAGKIASEVEIIGATIMGGTLLYQVLAASTPGGQQMRRWVPAASCQPSANMDEWNYGWWNRETESYEDPSDDT